MKTTVGLWGSNMPKYDDTFEYVGLDPRANTEVYTPQGSLRATGTDFTGSRPGGGLSGAISDEEQRELESKQAAKYVRDFGIQGLDILVGRINKRRAERAVEEERQAKLQKTAAESMKLTGEALEAMSKAQRGPTMTSMQWAERAAGAPQPGESPQQHAQRVLEQTPEARANVERRIPSVPASTRDKLAAMETTVIGLAQLRQEHNPVFTGQEAPAGKLGKFFGMENPAFTRFRARAQFIYAPARSELIGATQAPQEIESINRILPPDITQLSDIEAVEAINILSEMTQTKLNTLRHQYRLEQPTPTPPGESGGPAAQGHPLQGKPAGVYRGPDGRTFKWDGAREIR